MPTKLFSYAFFVIVGQLLSKAGENASLMRLFLTVLPVRELTKHGMPRNNVIISIIKIGLSILAAEKFSGGGGGAMGC